MRRLLFILLVAQLCIYSVAQTVTFTGLDSNNHFVQMNRVVVTNLTKGWQETIFFPDTTFTIPNEEYANTLTGNGCLKLTQNNPNPFNASTDVCLNLASDGKVTLIIADINGHTTTMFTSHLPAGEHLFRITLANKGNYVMAASQNRENKSITMMCNEGGGSDQIEYQGMVTAHNPTPPMPKYNKEYDQMEYVGYATIDDEEISSQYVTQTLGDSHSVTLRFNGKHQAGTGSHTGDKAREFRVALSLSPFSLNQFQDGYSFVVGNKTASTPEELQQIYRELGSTEMFVRIATKRHVTAENITDGKEDENANVHTFDQGIELCKIAAKLEIPINPEIMCAYTYMDMDKQQAPRFEEYPEIYALQNGKDWSELTLDEICTVLEAYGAFVGEAILSTGCTVNNWNLGNEANFGFAGISMGLKTAVNPKLKKSSTIKKYLAPLFGVWWLKKHLWKYDAKAYAALQKGILSAYTKLNIDASEVRFSTHIATVVSPARCSAAFFKCMAKNGYKMETAGISYYPSAPALSINKKRLLKKTVTKINKKCGIPVFIGEFSYPSGKMSGPFKGWNKKVRRYKHNQQGQADIYSDVIAWGKKHGMDGIRYWAPDYEGWYSMSMFEFYDKKGTAKTILKNHKAIIDR
ncbi:MAG: glycosyl hydrolase 53 family protein [Paludibacteraceae bacterium]|nr:glycosyl hydrolase 53 family protein [Paludibacteraceae bacterium]